HKLRKTLLHVACAGGHSDVVSFLVENQAELDPIDDEHQTPLIMAVQHMREECVLILLKNGANPWLKDINGDTALHHAALVSELPLARHLLDYNAAVDTPNKTGCTPLMVAVDKNDQEMATFLLECGADVNAKGRTGLQVDLFSVSLLIIVGNRAYHGDVMSKLNDVVGTMNLEYRRGLSLLFGEMPVLKVIVDDVILPSAHAEVCWLGSNKSIT
uniref:Uncharacterized protein n=1 Tax=Erpetoichthys calabaricus TaxID=27687 RepID=A0A8C4RLC2_ERPCA